MMTYRKYKERDSIMSYEIVISFSLNLKELTCTLRSASNNVYPKSFTPFTFGFTRKDYHDAFLNFSDKEIFLLDLIKTVEGGSFQLTKSVSAKYRYAFERLRDENRRAGNDVYDLYYKFKESQELSIEQILRSIVRRFEELLQIKDVKDEYIVKTADGYFIVKVNKRNYEYRRFIEGAKRFGSFKEAWLVAREINGASVIALSNSKSTA